MSKVLIIDDDQGSCIHLQDILSDENHQIYLANSISQAESKYNLDDLDVILCDLRIPDGPGTRLYKLTPTPLLVLTDCSSLRSSADAMNIGAVDYLCKPVKSEQLNEAINRVLTEDIKAINVTRLQREANETPVSGMVGHSPPMVEMFRRIRKVAKTDSSVLIQGESGTGKELVAKALHEHSSRKEAKLISVNCAAIPKNFIESELFGHEKGAFPGANTSRSGLIEEANNGTLFLDEISELPLDAQGRLLHVLQEKEIRKVGGIEAHKVDIRLVGATQRDLSELVKEGTFREDLYYRINVMPLCIPPLRVRGNDILELSYKKLKLACKRLNIEQKKFSADAIQVITTYPWPGNVRELENVIERAAVMSDDEEIPMELLGLDIELVKLETTSNTGNTENTQSNSSNDDKYIGETEKNLSLKDYFRRFVLEHQDELNETQLAKKLGISRKCLWERRQRFNIPRKKPLT